MSSERSLGRRSSFLVGCGIGVVLLLVVGLVVVWRGKKIEESKRFRTTAALEFLSEQLFQPQRVKKAPTPRADGSGADWTGQRALGVGDNLVLDGWGNPILYRCPGPVHKKGWDLWSCGPNGRNDNGTFDDILIGEDVAPESSR